MESSLCTDPFLEDMSEATRTARTDDRDVKEVRLEHPSGFLYLTKHESVPILVDALLDLPPGREFNKTELAEHAGVSRQTVSTHMDVLLDVGLVEEVPNTSPRRYRVAETEVVRELFEFNSALNAARGD